MFGHRCAREKLPGQVRRNDLTGGGLESRDQAQMPRWPADAIPRDPDAVGMAQRRFAVVLGKLVA